MSDSDLEAAAKAARFLAGSTRAIRDLAATGASYTTIKRLSDELNQNYLAAEGAIKTVVMELRRTRDSAVRFGDITAPTAHEAALEMYRALNRERFGVELIGRKNVNTWPDAGAVIVEIELETTKAKLFRDTAKQGKRRTGRPKNTEKDSATLVIAALSSHHGYSEGLSVTNYEPAKNRELAEKYELSENALSRFLKDRGGHKKYTAACRNKTVGSLLALWNREFPKHLADLLPEESGRGEDD